MKVKEVMAKKVITINKNATLREAAKILIKNKISGAPVVDDKGQLVGIVSEKDLYKALYPTHAEFYESPGLWIDLDRLEEKTREASDKIIEDFMSKEVLTVNQDTSIMQVGSMMLVRGVHRLVVTGQNNEILGIVTRRDIFHNIFKKQLGV